jgi:hypothetical protein
VLSSIDSALDRSATAAALAVVPAAAVLELLVQDAPIPDDAPLPDVPGAGRPRARLLGIPLPHVHHFRYAGDDAFSASSLYRCRCGVVKPGL